MAKNDRTPGLRRAVLTAPLTFPLGLVALVLGVPALFLAFAAAEISGLAKSPRIEKEIESAWEEAMRAKQDAE